MTAEPSYDVTEPQVKLTIELLGYVLLRLARSAAFPDFEHDLLPPSELEAMARKGQPFGWRHPAQLNAAAGALIHVNTVSAYNYAVSTFEGNGVLEAVPGCGARRVVVPYARIGEHLTEKGLLDHLLFETSVYQFFDCHFQAVFTNELGIPVYRNLRRRFDQAGLTDPKSDLLGWSQLMMQCIKEEFYDDQKVSPDQFFEQFYSGNDVIA